MFLLLMRVFPMSYFSRISALGLEGVAVSLGHVTRKGTPAVATTARYTQPNREQMKQKLKDIII